MPYYKIILHMRRGNKRSGVRNLPTEDVDRATEMVWTKIYDTIGRWQVDYLEVIPLPADDPQVVAWILRKVK
jgi:hypothetical protein